MHQETSAPAEPRDEAVERWNARLGLALFAVYAFGFVGFVLLAAFRPQIMATDLGGVNLAIAWGFALIVGAFALALVYAALARNPKGPR